MGKSGDRRARLGDAAVPGLFGGRRAHLPRFPGELRQWACGELAAGRGVQGGPWPLGNPDDQALDARIKTQKGFEEGVEVVAKIQLAPQMKPKRANCPKLNNRFP